MMRPLLPLLALLLLLPAPAEAQLNLLGVGDTQVEIPVEEDPGDRLARDLVSTEESSEARLDRLQERSRFFLERLDARLRELDRREREIISRRNELGRRGPQRREKITDLLEDIRGLSLRLRRIEEVWILQLDVLAATASEAAQLRNRIDAVRRSTQSGTVTTAQQHEARSQELAERVEQRLAAFDARLAQLRTDGSEHRILLDEARTQLQERDRQLLAEFAQTELGDDDDSAMPEPPPMVELSPQERELLQLDDERLRTAVQLLERLCELDRLEIAHVEADRARVAIELPVLAWERQLWSERAEALSVRQGEGLLFKSAPLFDRVVIERAGLHTSALLLDPQTTLEDMLGRIRRRPEERSSTSFLVWVSALGLLALFASVRLRRVVVALQPEGPGEVLARRAALATLPLLPVSAVCFPLYTFGGVPEVLIPLYRFATIGLPSIAVVVAVGTGLFPGDQNLGPQVARYARGVIRIGAGLAGLILVFQDALPLLAYPREVTALVRGLALGWGLLGWLLIVLRRAEILRALGADGSRDDVGLLRVGLRRFYALIALGPVAVYMVHAVGYTNLSRFLVQGGLVTLAVLLLAPWVHEHLRRLAARAVGYPDGGGWLALEPDGAKAAYQTVAPLILFGVGGVSLVLIAAGWRSGEKLGTLGSLITRPFVEVGGSHVSVGSVLLFAVTLVVTLLVSRQVTRLLHAAIYPLYDVDKGMRATLDTLARYLVLVTGVVVGLDVVGVGIGFLTVFAGIIGIGIGFGSQTLANNFISGLILLFARPVAVDDVIEVNGLNGRVVRISAYATVVRTLDNLNVVIPNSDLVSGQVVNWSVDDPRVRLSIVVGVAYGSDVPLVKRLLLDAAEADPRVLRRPKPLVRFDDFGDSALTFTLLPWTAEPDLRFQIASAIRMRVDTLFREHGVEIPFPQQDVHIRAGDGTLAIAMERGLEVQDADGARVLEADPKKQRAQKRAK